MNHKHFIFDVKYLWDNVFVSLSPSGFLLCSSCYILFIKKNFENTGGPGFLKVYIHFILFIFSVPKYSIQIYYISSEWAVQNKKK